MHRICLSVLSTLVILASCSGASASPFRLVIQGNNKLAIVGKDGAIEWKTRWGGIQRRSPLRHSRLRGNDELFDKTNVSGKGFPSYS